MRKLKNPPATSFRAIGRRLGLKVEMVEGRLVVMAPMWRKALLDYRQCSYPHLKK